MVIHEIVAIRKGSVPESRSIELNVLRNTPRKDGDGPSINATIHVEVAHEDLEVMFGDGFDVGEQVVLAELRFEAPEEEAEG